MGNGAIASELEDIQARLREQLQLLEELLDPVLTLEQAAILLEVCPTTVRRYTNRGVLRCFRTPGNQRRFQLTDVVEFLGKRREDDDAPDEEPSMKLDPATEDLTRYLKDEAIAWAGVPDIAASFGKAAVRSAQRDDRAARLEADLAVRDQALFKQIHKRLTLPQAGVGFALVTNDRMKSEFEEALAEARKELAGENA